jgi:hypothetical protein
LSTAERRLRQSLDEFLTAFRNLSLEPFLAAFAADSTVFFPFAEKPRRANGVREIEAEFSPLFETLRKRQPAGPPYLQIDPVDLRITVSGRLALVSFHLLDTVNEQAIHCRRTMVWTDDGTQWHILHLHASNLPAHPQ